MVCLDTDILIDFLKNKEEIVNKISLLKKANTNLTTTSINSFELFRGNLQLSEKSYSGAAELLLNELSIFNFTFKTSKKAAEIFNELKAKGNLIELPDIMIASVCIINNEPLLTRNAKHFERVPDLILEKL